jgi:hypothetical protein
VLTHLSLKINLPLSFREFRYDPTLGNVIDHSFILDISCLKADFTLELSSLNAIAQWSKEYDAR